MCVLWKIDYDEGYSDLAKVFELLIGIESCPLYSPTVRKVSGDLKKDVEKFLNQVPSNNGIIADPSATNNTRPINAEITQQQNSPAREVSAIEAEGEKGSLNGSSDQPVENLD